jgi:hypothetical protein
VKNDEGERGEGGEGEKKCLLVSPSPVSPSPCLLVPPSPSVFLRFPAQTRSDEFIHQIGGV